jgi:hypothetical protein
MPSMMATRALKRRLSNVVFAGMLEDQKRREETGPGHRLFEEATSRIRQPQA